MFRRTVTAVRYCQPQGWYPLAFALVESHHRRLILLGLNRCPADLPQRSSGGMVDTQHLNNFGIRFFVSVIQHLVKMSVRQRVISI
jgi:hypothetical protein